MRWISSLFAFLSLAGCAATPASLRARCDSGHGAACEELSRLETEGRGVPRNRDAAFADASAACDHGVMDGCADAGAAYLESPPLALPLLTKACDGGSTHGCVMLGFLLSAPGPNHEEARARALFARACDAGALEGCSSLVNLAHDRSPATLARLAKLADRGCTAGSPGACTTLGTVYDQGLGVKTDHARASTLWRSACDANDPLACYALAASLLNEKRDLNEALRLLERACDLELAPSCDQAARLYGSGLDGAPHDVKRAHRLAGRACELDPHYDCNAYGEGADDGYKPAPAK